MKSSQRRALAAGAPEERRERHEEMRDVRRADMREEGERREEIREDDWDYWHHRRHRVAVGTVYTDWDYSDEDCQASVTVDGVTYYGCDGVWYKRVYSGGTVTYVVVDGPRND